MNKKVLIIAAHPDDEILGCGSTIARLVREGHEAYTLILGEGITSRDEKRNRAKRQKAIGNLKGQIQKANKAIGVEKVFTHYEKDLNIDHQITYKAVLTASRPLPDEIIKEIYSFEVLSSTEWNYPLSFSPDVFFDVSETIDLKLKAMAEYKSELRDYPHPRSLEGIKQNAQLWGIKSGLKYAEAFKLVRKII